MSDATWFGPMQCGVELREVGWGDASCRGATRGVVKQRRVVVERREVCWSDVTSGEDKTCGDETSRRLVGFRVGIYNVDAIVYRKFPRDKCRSL